MGRLLEKIVAGSAFSVTALSLGLSEQRYQSSRTHVVYNNACRDLSIARLNGDENKVQQHTKERNQVLLSGSFVSEGSTSDEWKKLYQLNVSACIIGAALCFTSCFSTGTRNYGRENCGVGGNYSQDDLA